MLELRLKDAEATLELGRNMAKAMAKAAFRPALLLQGDLGSGKTTLIRGLVEALPGSEQAEVASPSFNIFNVYPTTPQVAHFDLYRLEGMEPDDALFDFLEDGATVTVIEWAQFLARRHWPHEALHLQWSPERSGRELTMTTIGSKASELLEFLKPSLSEYTTESDLT